MWARAKEEARKGKQKWWVRGLEVPVSGERLHRWRKIGAEEEAEGGASGVVTRGLLVSASFLSHLCNFIGALLEGDEQKKKKPGVRTSEHSCFSSGPLATEVSALMLDSTSSIS